jgi:hypothetical protein
VAAATGEFSGAPTAISQRCPDRAVDSFLATVVVTGAPVD